jgi:hypothetical protein
VPGSNAGLLDLADSTGLDDAKGTGCDLAGGQRSFLARVVISLARLGLVMVGCTLDIPVAIELVESGLVARGVVW